MVTQFAKRSAWTMAGLCLLAFSATATSEVGSEAPAFRLQGQDGKWHSLEDYRGKWVALYFYPRDATPGCTTQACEFAKEHRLPFTLLADPTKAVAKRYGVLKRYMGVMELARRDTFLVDPQGRIAKHYESVNPEGHSLIVLADIRSLKRGDSSH